METVKKIFMYILFIVGFYILSEFLINVGLNSTYKPLERKDNIVGVNIHQAEATLVNGRIRGVVTNTGSPDIQGKYMKIDIYSPRNVQLGTKYVDISHIQVGQTDSFEVFYKLQESSYYSISIVDEMQKVDDSPFFTSEFVQSKVIYWVVLAMILV